MNNISSLTAYDENEEEFECSECDYKCSNEEDIIEHSVTHSRESLSTANRDLHMQDFESNRRYKQEQLCNMTEIPTSDYMILQDMNTKQDVSPQQQAPVPKSAPEPVPVPQDPLILHQRVKLPPTTKQKYPTKRCYVHFHKYKTEAEARVAGWMKRKQTPLFCPMCPGNPGLCSVKCFNEYHTNKGLATIPIPVPQRSPIFHQRAKLPPTTKTKHPVKRCYVHFHKYKTEAEAKAAGWRKRRRTIWFCPLCPGNPGLCSLKCFKEHHTKEGFQYDSC